MPITEVQQVQKTFDIAILHALSREIADASTRHWVKDRNTANYKINSFNFFK